jgi:hypothetical protein
MCHKHSSSWPAEFTGEETQKQSSIERPAQQAQNAPKKFAFAAAVDPIQQQHHIYFRMSDKDTVVSGTQLNWSDVVILMTQPTHKDFFVLFFPVSFFFTVNSSHFILRASQTGRFRVSALCRDKRAGFMIFQLFFFFFFFFFFKNLLFDFRLKSISALRNDDYCFLLLCIHACPSSSFRSPLFSLSIQRDAAFNVTTFRPWICGRILLGDKRREKTGK